MRRGLTALSAIIDEVEKFFVQNFGCRAAQADGAALESLLAAKGLESSEDRAEADLVVLNTCTVTSSADEDVRQTIRRVHREKRYGDVGRSAVRTHAVAEALAMLELLATQARI